jgi:hypothetical protein
MIITAFATAALAIRCNRDNCFRAIISYQSKSDATFCSEYFATSLVFLTLIPCPPVTLPQVTNECNFCSTLQVPTSFATCGPARISSACSCLTPSPTTTTTTITTTSCSAMSSATGCPTPPNSCCQFFCGAALVPFGFCSPTNDISPFSTCTPCPA